MINLDIYSHKTNLCNKDFRSNEETSIFVNTSPAREVALAESYYGAVHLLSKLGALREFISVADGTRYSVKRLYH